MTGVRSEYGVGAIAAGEDYLLHYGTNERFDGTSRLIIAPHGHGGSAAHLQQNAQFNGRPLFAAVSADRFRSGPRYMCLGINAAGPATFGNQASIDSVMAAVAWAVARGARPGKFAMCGYSMAGGISLNVVKQKWNTDPACVGALLISPLSDLDWAYSTAGHTPVANNSTYTSEISTSFGGYPPTAGYRIWDEPASFRNGVPMKIYHPTDDTVVPYSLSTSLVAAINRPYVTLRQPDITGNHTGMFVNIPDEEVVAFYDSLDWSLNPAGTSRLLGENNSNLASETGSILTLESAP